MSWTDPPAVALVEKSLISNQQRERAFAMHHSDRNRSASGIAKSNRTLIEVCQLSGSL